MSELKSEWLRREARRAMRECGARGRTTPVPERAREAVVAYVVAARKAGRAWRLISDDVGLSKSALRRWSEVTVGEERVALVPVKVIADAHVDVDEERHRRSEHAITLLTPSGYRIEGLGVEQLATLLSRIGQ